MPSTLGQVRQRGFLMNDDPAPLADAYRQHCQRRGLPVVTVRPQAKSYLVTLDMTTTGHRLNVVGLRVQQQMAWRLGSVTPTDDGIRAYSLNTAATVAKRLASIGKDKRFWSR